MIARLKSHVKAIPRIASVIRWYNFKKHGKNYKAYVGGMWDEIGKLQFEFMQSQGLKPNHYFLDIACGALRGGRFFINYLDAGHYLGIDHNQWLINEGLDNELSVTVKDEKKPVFVVSDKFEFNKFQVRPDYALALSLFTHLTKGDIILCLENLRQFMKFGGRFFATFNIEKSLYELSNPGESGDAHHFEYTLEEIMQMAEQSGWKARYIGEWRHPRKQKMIEYT